MSDISPATHNEVIHANRISTNSQPIFSDWWCINDILGTQLLWYNKQLSSLSMR